MKIGIVEDEALHKENLLQLLKQWETQNHTPLSIEYFSSGEALLSKKSFDYHVIFLDVQLKETNGIEVAQELRKRNFTNELIFLTAYREYVFEGYDVHALNYILKPITYEKLDNCLQYIKQKLHSSWFVYQYRNEVTKIPYNHILYFSSSNQYTEIVTLNNTYRQAEALKNIHKNLPPQFVQCHRTLIVNIYHINKILGKELILRNNEVLPISKTYLKDVKTAFLQHLSLK